MRRPGVMPLVGEEAAAEVVAGVRLLTRRNREVEYGFAFLV